MKSTANPTGQRMVWVWVWDIGVRMFHWGWAISVVAAYALTGQRSLDRTLGFVVMGWIAFRLIWGLTPAERDVALLSIKGLPIAEIARLRDMREGRIKAQSTAIYRKVGVSNRAELIAVMVERLFSGVQAQAASNATEVMKAG